MNDTDPKNYLERIGWLRAAVLGANDGIVSTTNFVIGVSAAMHDRLTIVISAVAGLAAGAMSMAAGEYVSVSSQASTEKAELVRKKKDLALNPKGELLKLAMVYERKGLSKARSLEIAKTLTAKDAIGAHANDVLGITDIAVARPMQAAFASFGSFIFGAIFPVIVSLFAPIHFMVYWQYGFTIIFLMLLGALSALTGGYNIFKGAIRICIWGTIAMLISAVIGYLFHVQT